MIDKMVKNAYQSSDTGENMTTTFVDPVNNIKYVCNGAWANPTGKVYTTSSNVIPTHDIHTGECKGLAMIRVLNNVARKNSIYISVDGSNHTYALKYGKISHYAPINAGNRNINVNLASVCGTRSQNLVGNYNLKPCEFYTLIIHGVCNSSTTPVSGLLLKDRNTSPVSGKSVLRFIHGAAGAQSVNVYARKSGSNTTPRRVYSGKSYGQVSNYSEVPSGTYDLFVTTTGVRFNSDDVVTKLPNVQLKSKFIYNVVASGTVNDSSYPLGAVVAFSGPRDPRIDSHLQAMNKVTPVKYRSQLHH